MNLLKAYMKSPIQVVDLFAGPGGLGEGFSGFNFEAGPTRQHPFQTVVSVEMDRFAYQTLRLRAFYRQFGSRTEVPEQYFDFIGDPQKHDLETTYPEEWAAADAEVLQLELGKKEDDRKLNRHLEAVIRSDQPLILIGGPPCQAYSVVGRSRNRGVDGYSPEEDLRHYLYREYLRIIRKHRPSVFVMENVKGILSSSVDGAPIFRKILADLMDPDRAFTKKHSRRGCGYRLYSMLTGKSIGRDEKDAEIDPRDFILQSEDYGVPQRRHRVFVLGVREDVSCDFAPILEKSSLPPTSLESVIGDLPELRSGLSPNENGPIDSFENWFDVVIDHGGSISDALLRMNTFDLLGGLSGQVAAEIRSSVVCLRNRKVGLQRSVSKFDADCAPRKSETMPVHLRDWILRNGRNQVLNHETRLHMPSDLGRYLFSASWGRATGNSPKASDFPDILAPDHRNWKSGNFNDRFRVQLAGEPATTITSHISKDGHYFIHYDPVQCRSLTVREAARIQTFPDDYVFMGPRTHQYNQVGNAVPPYLAEQIAGLVFEILKTANFS